MQFNSLPFLFYFFPPFLALYYIVPQKWRNGVLLVGSFLFYAIGSEGKLWWCGLLLGLTAATYVISLQIGKHTRGLLLGFSIAGLGVVLAFFKLYQHGALLPPGMSFYLFQMVAAFVAIYTGKMHRERNFLRYATQMSMFPKLLSGPLMEPDSLRRQVLQSRCDTRKLHDGLQELIAGLALKVLLANRLGGLWGQISVFGYEYISTPLTWMALAAYAMRLYFDFWGYSLMAMGLGKMLGFTLPQNFRDPYAAKSISDFYRRWHVTLNIWFRDNLYIPLGGSRKGTARTILNLAVVWAVTGLWHGIGGNYLLWAGILFFFIVLEKLFLRKWLEKTHVVSHIYVVFIILLSWVPYAIGDWTDMLMFLGRLFCCTGRALNPMDYVIWGKRYFWLLLTGAIFMTPLPGKLWRRFRNYPVMDIILFILFAVAVYMIAVSAQDPFMYFQF